MKRIFLLFLIIHALKLSGMGQDWDGTVYHAHSQPQQENAKKIIDAIQFTGDESIISFGCGTGENEAYLASKVPKGFVVGIDASKEMIDLANKNNFHRLNIHFSNGKAEVYSFEQKVDYVFAFSSLHWMKNQQMAISNMAHQLKPQGIFAAVMALDHQNEKRPIISCLLKVGMKSDYQEYLSQEVKDNISSTDPKVLRAFLKTQYLPANAESIRPLLENAGLTPIDLKEEKTTVKFKNKEDFAQFLLGWTGGCIAIASIPSSVRKPFIDDVVNEYCATIPPQHDDSIEYPRQHLFIKAVKN